MTHRRLALVLALLLPALAVPAMFLAGQENAGPGPAVVKWRTNYNQARKESQEKKLPLFIDFYTDPCVWCVKLDNSTFRDPRMVAFLNERCIPLKLDARVETTLVDNLRLRAYPSMVIASSEGQILEQIEGFKEAAQLLDTLQRHAPAAPAPGVDFLVRDFQLASTLVQKGEFARAVSLLRNIVDEGKGKPIQLEAQKSLADLGLKANSQLEKAKQLKDKGQINEAVAALTETLRVYPGLPAAKEAAELLPQLLAQTQNNDQRLAQRGRRAQELLNQAKEFYKNRDYIPCLDRCEILLASYGDLQEGQEASILAGDIRNNPEWLQSACDTMSDRLGSLWLAVSDTMLKKGERQRAEFYLQRVIQAFPGSRQAESAQIRLSQIRGIPANRVEVQASQP